MNHDEQLLKHACDMVMDAFDDAVLTVPGTKSERIVALVDVLLPRLIDRAAEAGAIDHNHDLNSQQQAAFMRLLRYVMEETSGCCAAIVTRITLDGQVLVSGATKDMRSQFMAEIAPVITQAVFQFAAQRGNAMVCGCPRCVQKRATEAFGTKGAAMPFTGPKAEA